MRRSNSNSTLPGALIPRSAEPHRQLGAADGKGQVHVRHDGWQLWHGHHVAADRHNHRVDRVDLRILHPGPAGRRGCLLLVVQRHRHAHSAPAHQGGREEVHRGLVPGQGLPDQVIASPLAAGQVRTLLVAAAAALRQPLGHVLPADGCAQVHERGAALQPDQVRIPGRPALPGAHDLRLYLWQHWGLDNETGPVERHHYPEDILRRL